MKLPSTFILATGCTATLLLLTLLYPSLGARGHTQLKARVSGAYAALTEQSSDRQGNCRLEYTVKTWDAKYARVCDPSVCAGRDKLKMLAAAGPRRWSPAHEAAYMQLYNANTIDGWLKVS
jgi:hypothetical protein